MGMGEYHRAVGQFVAAGILIIALIIARALGLRVEQWSPITIAASIALMVALALTTTLWISKRRRS